MTTTTDLIVVKDQNEIDEFTTLRDYLLNSQIDFNRKQLVRNKWAVIPVESANHFNEKDAECLSAAIQLQSCNECYAIATESLENSPILYCIKPTPLGLLSFSKECSFFNYLLTTRNSTFAILCTTYDYYLVAGQLEFLKASVGTNLKIARSSFLEFANDPAWSVPTKERLLNIYTQCEKMDYTD